MAQIYFLRELQHARAYIGRLTTSTPCSMIPGCCWQQQRGMYHYHSSTTQAPNITHLITSYSAAAAAGIKRTAVWWFQFNLFKVQVPWGLGYDRIVIPFPEVGALGIGGEVVTFDNSTFDIRHSTSQVGLNILLMYAVLRTKILKITSCRRNG
ncbi:hypothetical protein B0F90DRAFT_737782 [Multifurca ochricompacta]|uniref:Uncharacterized protein n=1 Tax=Multifurca ochricompacta TaxID=376703 RepID=A0AAD4MB26_9AGAM|nr:hypothetical protein B0F90DRAFT_737782 [Multifurca ochricompacta]